MTETRRSEWAANWPLLLAAVVGIPVPAAMSQMLGVFMVPLEQEFGWTRTEASIGYSISLVLGFLSSPLIGRLVDKSNARLLALPGIMLTGLAIAAFSLATSSIGLWIALWCMVSLVGGLVGPSVWLAVVSGAFEKNRSLAISITLCGMSLAGMLAPLSARLAIDAFGWRMAWMVLGAIWSGPALILSLLFFFDRRPTARPKAEQPDATGPKPELRRVFLSSTFIRLGLGIATIGLVGSSFGLHMAPALVDKGISPTTAAVITGIPGLMGIVGRLTMGTFFDRVGQTRITLGVMVLYALASVILAQESASVPLAAAGCLVLGLAGGGLHVFVACVVTRLFHATIFGVVYGSLTSLSVLAAASGPLLTSWVHDTTGTYTLVFWSGTAAALIASLLLMKLVPVEAS